MNVAAIPQQEEGSSRRRRMEAALAEDIEEQQEEGITVRGPWALVLKANLILAPVFAVAVIGWGSWVTVETIKAQSFREQGARVTPLDLAEHESMMYRAIAKLPSQEYRLKIEKLESVTRKIELNQVTILDSLNRLEKR